ncbi:hypothetical protein L0222_25840 [bacterium]|nr:hypothetical protein [bacterium]MCI0602703.1 hypothetical protein [bacterium]
MKRWIFKIFCYVAVLLFAHVCIADEISLTANFLAKGWISRNETLELQMSRPLNPSDGRLAVFIGTTDMTNLFETNGTSLKYIPQILPLPAGEKEVIVYRVTSEQQWIEVGRFPIKVLTRGGFEKATFTPKIDLNNKGQLDENHDPATNAPPRSTYQDFGMQSNFQSEFVRGDFTLTGQANVIGTSYENEALRFATEGKDAPLIDLSSYVISLQKGPAGISLGHVSFGSNPHLINSFSSRGISGIYRFGKAADLSMAAINGTSIVGWDNFVGLNSRKHQILSATFGLELNRSRPGGFRVEASILDGSVLPLTNFNQNVVNDAEESRGAALRVQFSDASQRLRLEGGYTRSKFINPNDPLLSQGVNLVPVREEDKDARYLDLSYGILQNKVLKGSKTANFTLTYRHERAEPFFKSVAAFVQADRMQNVFEVQGTFADISIQINHSRSQDNLDDVPSILKTLTRGNTISLGFPLQTLFGGPGGQGPNPWWPAVTYAYNRTHQFGDSLPVNSDFAVTHVPDQISGNHSASADWQLTRWRFGYRLGQSSHDNRQTGRENADLRNLIHTFTLGLNPKTRLSMNFDVNLERAKNNESGRLDLTRRFGLNLNWQATDRFAVSSILNTTRAHDEADTSKNKSYGINLETSYRFGIFKASQGQLYLRYANQVGETNDQIFGINQRLEGWTITSGVNFSLL